MKIGFLVNDLALGGAQKVVFDIVSRLSPSEFEPVIFPLIDYESIYPGRANLRGKFEELGIKVINIGASARPSLADLKILKSAFIKERPHVIHTHLPLSSIFGTVAARWAGIKKIIIHEHNTHNFYSTKIRLALKGLRPFTALTICYSDAVEKELFNSENILTDPLEKINRKSYTIYNGVDLGKVDAVKLETNFEEKRKSVGLLPEDIVIICAARFVDWKAQEYLIKAFSMAAKGQKDIKLLLAGDGPRLEPARKLAADLNISQKVFFLGPRNDIFELLSISDIFSLVFAYPDDFNSEGIGVAGLEAMAFSLPPLIGDYPESHKFIKNDINGLLVEPKNPEALSKAIIKLAVDKSRRAAIGVQARKFVEKNFSLENIVSIYESVYKLI